ncbi:glyoxalase [Skermania sp. ID1734]|uniref:VOC family protein n=1 Tax=Skermania sp. ID1734 TaxID=2597516 RepID=UPI00117D7CD3|nr:VOC family protein [Skermania sp. ID1734]TSE00758.1 glyoxalase [Skermania sp. ID1734]
MQQRINFVTLVVQDLAVSRNFYVSGLGWTPALDVPGEVLMFAVADKVVLSLWAREHAEAEIGPVNAGGAAPFTLAHNCAEPAGVDNVLADAGRAGAQVSAARQREWGGYSGYFADPDGFRWEVAFNPHPIGGITLP